MVDTTKEWVAAVRYILDRELELSQMSMSTEQRIRLDELRKIKNLFKTKEKTQ